MDDVLNGGPPRPTLPGISSRYFTAGMYPRQEKWIAMFNRRYLDARGPLPPS